jgi:peptide/nickel transport system substrate-binding protein
VRRTSRLQASIAVLALAAAALAGCSSASGDPNSSSKGSAAALLKQGTLVLGLSRQLTGLDPGKSGSVDGDASIDRAIYASLTVYTATNQLEPDLATSWKQTGPAQWTFTLQPGAKFANGTPLDAAQVAWNFDRMLAPNTTLSGAATTTSWVSSVSAPNATTLVINTKGPILDAPERLSAFFIANEQYVGAHPNGLSALASGPYEIKSYDVENGATLVPNPDYYGPKPSWKEVIYKVLSTEAARVQAAEADTIDVALQYDPTDLRLFNSSSVYATGITTSSWNNTIRFNEAVKPLNNVLVRQAINYAIDKTSIIKNILGVNEQPLAGQVVSKPYDTLVNPTLSAYPYDPTKAKQLLAQAGYPNGFSIELGLTSGTYVAQAQIAQVIAQELGAVGIKAGIVNEDFGTWVDQTESGNAPALYYIAYSSGYPSPAARLQIYSDSDLQSHYSPADTTYDKDVAELQNAATPDQQQALFDQATDNLYQEAQAVFLWPQPLTYVISKDLSWIPNPAHWLDPQDITLKS